jgi:hypothetical protein
VNRAFPAAPARGDPEKRLTALGNIGTQLFDLFDRAIVFPFWSSCGIGRRFLQLFFIFWSRSAGW